MISTYESSGFVCRDCGHTFEVPDRDTQCPNCYSDDIEVYETQDEINYEEPIDEELETYVPRSSTYTSADEVDENDTSTGVNIDYDL